MGMYTLFNCHFELDAAAPAEVREFLSAWWAGDLPNEQTAPALCACPRWTALRGPRLEVDVICAYFDEPSERSRFGDVFYTQSSLKNYNKEIETFLEWVEPHCLWLTAWWRYEAGMTNSWVCLGDPPAERLAELEIAKAFRDLSKDPDL